MAAYSLARFSGKEEFASYVLVFSIMLVFNGIQQALVTSPMSVLGPGKRTKEFKRYATAMFFGQMLLNVGFVSLTLLSILGIRLFPSRETGEFKQYATSLFVVQILLTVGLFLLCILAVLGARFLPINEKIFSAMLGMTISIIFIQFQEFIKRLLYVKLRVNALFMNDLIFCSIRLAGIFLLLTLGSFGADERWLTAQNIFLAGGAAGLVAGVVGFYQTREYYKIKLKRMVPDVRQLKENWNFGKWVLGSFAGSILESQASYLIVAGVVGLTAAATLEAPRLIMAPLQVLTSAGASMLTPLLSKKYDQDGKQGLIRILSLAGSFWMVALLTYFLVIVAAPGFWLNLFYKDNFAGGEPILVLWSLVFLVQGLQVLPEITLMAIRKPDTLMRTGLSTGVLTLVLTLVFSMKSGALGAVLARLIGEAAYLAVMLLNAIKLYKLKTYDTGI